jgi:hypothetical protein
MLTPCVITLCSENARTYELTAALEIRLCSMAVKAALVDKPQTVKEAFAKTGLYPADVRKLLAALPKQQLPVVLPKDADEPEAAAAAQPPGSARPSDSSESESDDSDEETEASDDSELEESEDDASDPVLHLGSLSIPLTLTDSDARRALSSRPSDVQRVASALADELCKRIGNPYTLQALLVESARSGAESFCKDIQTKVLAQALENKTAKSSRKSYLSGGLFDEDQLRQKSEEADAAKKAKEEAKLAREEVRANKQKERAAAQEAKEAKKRAREEKSKQDEEKRSKRAEKRLRAQAGGAATATTDEADGSNPYARQYTLSRRT